MSIFRWSLPTTGKGSETKKKKKKKKKLPKAHKF